MYPGASSNFISNTRRSGVDLLTVDAWLDGSPIVRDLTVVGGSGVSVDTRTPGVTRKLSVSLEATTELEELLATPRLTLHPHKGVRYLDGSTEFVPLGAFLVDEDQVGYDESGDINVTCPDLWAKVQRSKFTTPEVTNGLAVEEAARIVADAFRTIDRPDIVITASSFIRTRSQVWEQDRDEAALALVKAAGAQILFDADGTIIVRDIPNISQVPVWTVNAGVEGNLLGAARKRSMSRTYNCVVVTPEAVDGRAPFAPVILDDEDPDSPTYVSEPADRVPYFYSSPLIVEEADAITAAASILPKVRGVSRQLSLDSTVNAALEPGDVIRVTLPDGTTERHLVESFNVPFDVGTPQRIELSATGPDEDVET